MPRDRANRLELEERLEKVEEMLCAGIAPGRVERTIARDYDISGRQARKYITKVYERWQAQTTADAPHRREKIIRMVERFYSKALVAKQWVAGAQALNLLVKLSSGFVQHDRKRDKFIASLGAPPKDPGQVVLYAQRIMVFTLSEVAGNPAIDPERRMRWITELGSKLGLTQDKAQIEARLVAIEEALEAERGREISPGETDTT